MTPIDRTYLQERLLGRDIVDFLWKGFKELYK